MLTYQYLRKMILLGKRGWSVCVCGGGGGGGAMDG